MIKKNIIPTNWLLTTIGEIGIVTSGGTPSTKKHEYFGGEISWITPADLSKYTNKFISNGERSITIEGLNHSSAKLVPKGTVLFSSRAPIGYTVIAQKELATNQGFKNLITTESMSNEYVYYYFRTLKPLAEKEASGTTFLEISGSKFSNLPFPLAPLDTQKKIVSKIKEIFTEIDYNEKNLKDTLNKLEQYEYLTTYNLFEKKKNWNSNYIEDIFELIDGDRGKNYPKKDEQLTEGYCLFLSTKNVRTNYFSFEENNFISKEKHETLRNGLLSRGDIVLTTRGTLGNVALYDESIQYDKVRINSNMIIMRCKKKDMHLKYILHYLTSPHFKKQIKENFTGSAQPQLPAKILKKLKISYPSNNQQVEIEKQLKHQYSLIENLKSTILLSLQKAELLKKKILSNAFSGKLINCESKESVSLLLKQIQNEKKEYLKEQKNEPKKQPIKGKVLKDLSILEIVKKSDSGILAKDLFLQSKYKDNIEEFYSELKKIEDKIIIENNNKDSMVRIKNEN